MEGGRLLGNLERHGIRPEDVHIVALTHLHADHVGWVGDAQGETGVPECKVRAGSRRLGVLHVAGRQHSGHISARAFNGSMGKDAWYYKRARRQSLRV